MCITVFWDQEFLPVVRVQNESPADIENGVDATKRTNHIRTIATMDDGVSATEGNVKLPVTLLRQSLPGADAKANVRVFCLSPRSGHSDGFRVRKTGRGSARLQLLRAEYSAILRKI